MDNKGQLKMGTRFLDPPGQTENELCTYQFPEKYA